MSTTKVRVPEIQYSSTESMSTPALPRAPKFDPFHQDKNAPKLENHQTMTKITSVLKVIMIHLSVFELTTRPVVPDG